MTDSGSSVRHPSAVDGLPSIVGYGQALVAHATGLMEAGATREGLMSWINKNLSSETLASVISALGETRVKSDNVASRLSPLLFGERYTKVMDASKSMEGALEGAESVLLFALSSCYHDGSSLSLKTLKEELKVLQLVQGTGASSSTAPMANLATAMEGITL